MDPKQDTETKGTKLAAKGRQAANKLTTEERQAALGKAMELIYKRGRDKATADRR